MKKLVTLLADFQKEWEHNINFMMGGECVPFDFKFPTLATLVDVLRHDAEARIQRGGYQGKADTTDISTEFRKLPIEKALDQRFSLAHFKLDRFTGPGQILHGFEEHVMDPWRDFLRRAGFEWERCYPILFISGANTGTAYHMDNSHVVAWQIYGTKIFSGLTDPGRFSPIEKCVQKSYQSALTMPDNLKDEDILSYTMNPGDALWNQLLTPHWVDATNEVAVSCNISHGILRRSGKLCPNEQRLSDWWDSHPEEAWRVEKK